MSISDLDGKNNLDAAFCDAYVEGVDDVMQHLRQFRMEKDPQKKVIKKRTCMKQQHTIKFAHALFNFFVGFVG